MRSIPACVRRICASGWRHRSPRCARAGDPSSMPVRRSNALRERVPAAARWPAIRRRRPRTSKPFLRSAAAGVFLAAGAACAQVSGTLSVMTDYRYRGISLSAGDPALQGSVVYDDPSGAYAGLFASNVEFAISHHRELEVLPYVGYVRRLASGLAVEIGAEYAAFTGPGEYNYP